VCREIIRHRGKARAAEDVAPAGGDMMKGLRYSDRKRYSYARAILLAAGHGKLDGIEAEMHQALSDRYLQAGLSVRQNSVLVPMDLRTPDEYWQQMERRALDSKTGTKGAETVFEQPGELIELLRNRSAVVALGARTLTGLSGPVGFPKQTGAGTASWVGENPAADLADSDLALGLVTMQPKTLQSTTAYSRQLLVQSSVDAEGLVRNDLALIHALAWDRAAIHGQSAAGQPTGIYLAPDVSSEAHGGNPTYLLLLSQAGKVADQNADEGSLGWVTTPLMAAKLKGIAEHPTGTMANWIWQGTFREGTVLGYPARATNQVSKTMVDSAESGGSQHGIVFGNWGDMLIGMFGSLEIVVDPYAKKKRALIEVTSFQMVDILLRHGQSFSKSHGATIA
jgi:HK97 family phage major capsid protein